eukprot:SAG11_NODE_4063_length_2082_cov_1.845688_1_plen_169_part_00
MLGLATLALIVGSASLVASGNPPRPIIGILAQPLNGVDSVRSDLDPSAPFEPAGTVGKQYIAASYIKFVESAGARAVPILYDSDKATLLKLFSSVNGILFPGGSASLQNSSRYYIAGKTLYDAAVSANQKGDHFPIWGTCLVRNRTAAEFGLYVGLNLVSSFGAVFVG